MKLFDFFKRTAPVPQKRFFAGARVDRFTAGWLATSNSINRELQGDLDKLRLRSRDLVKNNEFARKFKKLVVANVVGANGFMLQSRVENSPGQPDQIASDSIERAFYEWCRKGVCEISGKVGFVDLTRAVMGGLPSDGEYMVRMVRGNAARNAFGFALQIIDIDRLDTKFNVAPSRNQNAIVMGVEIDAYRRPVAYHILTSHPDENGSRQRERVSAEDILHDFIYEHAEQTRGVPWMSAAILSLHHLGKFEESALLAARKGADTLGFFVSPDGDPPPIGDTSQDSEPITVSVPGSYDTLPEGYDFRQYDSKYPDAMLADFNKYFLRKISAGFNVAYNGLANDLEGVNFSSIRAGVLEERDQWMSIQNWFAESFLVPVFNAWLEAALLKGMVTLQNGTILPASRLDKFRAHTWQGRRWPWVDPLKDIEAARLAVRSGVTSPQQIAAQMGMDLDTVLADITRFEQLTANSTLIDYNDKAQPVDNTLPASS